MLNLCSLDWDLRGQRRQSCINASLANRPPASRPLFKPFAFMHQKRLQLMQTVRKQLLNK